jgi:hypothetical protein
MRGFHHEEFQSFTIMIFDEHPGAVGDEENVTSGISTGFPFEGDGHGSSYDNQVNIGVTVVFGDFFSGREYDVVNLHFICVHDLFDEFRFGALKMVESRFHGYFFPNVS